MANPAAGCRNAHSPVRALISSRCRPLRQVSSSSLGITVNPPTYSIGETFCLRGGGGHRLTALFNSIAYWGRGTMTAGYVRSGEGRVGKECRSRWVPDHLKKKKGEV